LLFCSSKPSSALLRFALPAWSTASTPAATAWAAAAAAAMAPFAARSPEDADMSPHARKRGRW